VLAVQGAKNCKPWFLEVNNVRNLLAHPIRGDISDDNCDFLQRCKKQIEEIVYGLVQKS